MRITSLLYHDVVASGEFSSSGFPGGDADIYKLDRATFAAHLDAIGAAAPGPVSSVLDLLERQVTASGVVLTFDDGGVGACQHTAGLLEERGWVGHFFITTSCIGQPGFLSAEQLRDLRRRGHIIGSHSCSHPVRMSACTPGQLLREWGDSLRRLSEILGEEVTTASVPGGFYSRSVGETAAQSGVRALFNSEPTSRVRSLGDCWLLGRYSVQRATPASAAAGLAANRLSLRARQALLWNAKKVVKTLGGKHWIKARKRLLNG